MNQTDWFHELPARWTRATVGHHFDVGLGKMLNGTKTGEDGAPAPYLAAGSIQPEHLALDEPKTMPFTKDELTRYDLRKDDIVVVEGGAGYGRSHLLTADMPGWGYQNHVARIRRAGAVRSGYLLYCLKACLASGYIEANNRTATLPSLSRDVLRALPIPVPPLQEQRQISDFLDSEIGRIDTLIEQQQRLIDTLRERRTSVIRTAVPDPRSGSVAADKLGRHTRIGNGSTPRRESRAFWEGGHIPWLNSSVVNQDRVDAATQFVTDDAAAQCHLPLVPAGSLLVALTGQGKTRGMATILDFEATINQHMAYVSPDADFWDSEYLLWSLTAAYAELRAISDENGSTKGALTCDELKRFRVAHPSLAEQRRIAAHLEAQTSMIDTLIAETERFIELARERRSALITAAVTGQIDVRGEVA